jgi:hypothetical protein
MTERMVADNVAVLAYRPRQAAKALGIGERLLFDLTKRDKIPHLRLGRAVVYPVEGLRLWLAEQSAKPVNPDAPTGGAGRPEPAGTAERKI